MPLDESDLIAIFRARTRSVIQETYRMVAHVKEHTLFERDPDLLQAVRRLDQILQDYEAGRYDPHL